MRWIALLGLLGTASAAEPVRYTLTFPAPETHYVEVEAVIPTDGQQTFEVMLPVWTPGSYLVRDYARHLEAMRVVDGRATKVAKNRWRIEVKGPRATLRYRLYGRLMSVRTNFIERDFALIIGAATFVTRPEHLGRGYAVQVQRPEGWRHVATGLPRAGRDRFTAPDFDTLVDSPLLIGDLSLHQFEVDGKVHVLATAGGGPLWDGARAARDFKAVVETHRDFWGALPYESYHVLNLLVETGGGLEHVNSTVLMGTRWAQRDPARYRNWLRLASHEFFHTWNVKRLRPLELGPFDYETENYTRSLWIAEGVTSYYDVLLSRRADLWNDAQLLEALSKKIKRVQQNPGRKVRSLEAASFDAWIKFYKPDENSNNVSTSYYTKGSVVAFLLDQHIRATSGGKGSLDAVMRLASARHSGKKGYTTEQFYALCSEVAGADISRFFADYTAGTAELDYAPALARLGLRFKPKKAKKPGEAPPGAYLGVDVHVQGGALVVRRVPRDTPAHAAGINAEDELIAFDQERLPPAKFAERLKLYRPGTEVSVLVARRGRLLRLQATLAAAPDDTWTLEVDPDATAEQKARFALWTTGKPPPPPKPKK